MKLKKPFASRQKLTKLNLKPVDKKARRIEKATLRHAHKFVLSRWSNIRSIRRHVVAWLVLVALLCGLAILQTVLSYRSVLLTAPSAGGVYAEGMVGSFRTLNPLFASSQAELAASKLLFSGLLRYDEAGHLQPDLATSWRIEDKGKKYTLALRHDVTWHDGKPFTAKDVLYTVETLQNPTVSAPSFQSWRGIKVTAIDNYTVVFELPNAYAPFGSQLTAPVLPQHILAKVRPDQLQENNFGQQPIGTGPFYFSSLKTLDVTTGKTLLQLDAFDHYWQGRPKLNRFSLTTYSTETELTKAFRSHEINAASDLTVSAYNDLSQSTSAVGHLAPINDGVYAFFNTTSSSLKDLKLRQALLLSTTTQSLQESMRGVRLAGPIVSNQLPQATGVAQPQPDSVKAAALYEELGYIKDANGKLVKGKQKLQLKIASVNTPAYRSVINRLATQWEKFGVTVIKQFVDPEQIQQSVLQTRDYDVLVYEIEVGGDPDVYAYWHPTQAGANGLNFSGYSSSLAGDALVAGRARSDWSTRDLRYTSFAKQWVADTPAIALYQSTLRYVSTNQITSISDTQQLPTPADRYSNIIDWSVEKSAVYKTP